ncbi:MAG TPA: TPM domain-containing protein [Spirochaetota bacterium]|nr:TPM domain-containing protein [Spirochaetota bacterium]HOL57088.1 TPM domain-containing protein [Spirochaetota bacterium]HPP04697.1 TPM domain-containing protein [Spirochaetota bacterium]
MNKKMLYVFIFMVTSFLFSQNFPQLTGRVVDKTGTLTNSQIIDLESILKNYEEKTQHQMVVVIIPSLEGYPIEEYSIKLAEKWKIGRKDFDDGIIILVSMGDRKIRIEVGYGLESELTDAESFLIIERIIKPAFRNGDYYSGIKNALYQIIKETGGELTENRSNTDITTYNYNSYKKNYYLKQIRHPYLTFILGFIFAIFISLIFKKISSKINKILGFISCFILSIIGFLIAGFLFQILFFLFLFAFMIGLFILNFGHSIIIGSSGSYDSGRFFGGWNDYSSSSGGWGDSDSGFDGFSGGGGDFGGGGASGDW